MYDAAKKIRQLERLVKHCWVHSGFHDCGFDQMDTAQKELYRLIVDRSSDEDIIPKSKTEFD
jgi:ssRNA-specific RNase YbeY (16S rRNA maturation enzyme)